MRRNRGLWSVGLLVVLVSTVGFTWGRSPGNHWGAPRGEGVGAITGSSGGYPVRVAAAPVTASGYVPDTNLVHDLDGDGVPEVYLNQGRTVGLYDASGQVLARSGDLGDNVQIVGVYDLDGDGVSHELVVTVAGAGGRDYVLDAVGLGTLWHGADRGSNYGARRGRTVVADLDDDGIDELIWRATPVGGFQVVTFKGGLDSPEELEIAGPFSGSWGGEPPVVGDFLRQPGLEVATPNYGPLRIFGVAAQSAADTNCTLDASLCVNTLRTFNGAFRAYYVNAVTAADLDGDGLDEVVAYGAGAPGTVEITAIDPNSGAADLDTAAARMWSYRYAFGAGKTLRVATSPSAVDGATSNLGEAVASFAVFDDTDTESNPDLGPVDDCLSLPGEWGSVVVDGLTGTPLASLPGATPLGSVDPDGDGVSELLYGDTAVDGTVSGVRGYSLICGGPSNESQWSGCDNTGCVLVEDWSVLGEPARFSNEPRAQASQMPFNGLGDLVGDATPELFVVENETDLVAYTFNPSTGQPVEHARHALGTCSQMSGLAGVPGARHVLMEGDATQGAVDCIDVLDDTLTPEASFTVNERANPYPDIITGSLGGGQVALGYGDLVYPDAAQLAAPQRFVSPLGRPFRPTLFVDLDGDGVDELIVFDAGDKRARDPVTGELLSTWSIARYDWNGTRFVANWVGDAASLGLDAYFMYGSQAVQPLRIVAGDFDGDGALEIGAYLIDNLQRPGQLQDRMVFFSATGDGAGHAAVETDRAAPETGTSGLYWTGAVPVGDVCDAVGCPGTDGVDEYIMSAGNHWEIHNAAGMQKSFGSHAAYGWNNFADDLDGDGFPELITVQPNVLAAQDVAGNTLWRVNPGGAMLPGIPAGTTVDIDGDGVRDVIIGKPTGELLAVSGVDGATLAGFPVFLTGGVLNTVAPAEARGAEAMLALDIDGDGADEVVVSAGDGRVYSLGFPGGVPTLEWSADLGGTALRLVSSDLDGDGKEELIASLSDATVVVLDGGDGLVSILTPTAGDCFDANTFTTSGTAQGADQVEIWVGGVATEVVDVGIDGSWVSGVLSWGGPGTKRVEAHGLRAGRLIAAATILVDHWTDDDGDGYSECTPDCDDNDITRFPGNPEVCDGVDNDCDLVVPVDELDGDGDGYSPCEGDCDDANTAIYAGAPEVADGLDNNCDGVIDEGTSAYDDDGDGFTEAGGDCDDTNAARSPAGTETANGVDDDCDGTVDNGTAAYDDDGDGATEDGGDCDDGDASVHPGAPDVVNGVDDDCDGVIDEGSDTSDDDGDGLSEAAGDCDDANTDVYPGAMETADGMDNDCDGLVDEGTVAFDDDGDGITEADGDCDDADAAVAPGRPDGCTPDGLTPVDNNCDGVMDEECVAGPGDVTASRGGCDVSGSGLPGSAGGLALLGLVALRRRRRQQ